MADHPFHGTWSSYGLNDAEQTVNDGEMRFDILPDGNYRRGDHKPRLGSGGLGNEVTLERLDLSTTEIHIKETSSEHCEYHGFLIYDPFKGNRKLIIGTYKIARQRSSENPLGSEGRRSSEDAFDQINGTWVATQP